MAGVATVGAAAVTATGAVAVARVSRGRGASKGETDIASLIAGVIRPFQGRIEALESEVAELRKSKDAEIAELRRGLRARDGEIRKLRQGIAVRDAQIAELRQRVDELMLR